MRCSILAQGGLEKCVRGVVPTMPHRKTVCMKLILHTSFSQCMLSHDILLMCACTSVLEFLYNIDRGDLFKGLSQRRPQFKMYAGWMTFQSIPIQWQEWSNIATGQKSFQHLMVYIAWCTRCSLKLFQSQSNEQSITFRGYSSSRRVIQQQMSSLIYHTYQDFTGSSLYDCVNRRNEAKGITVVQPSGTFQLQKL